MKFNTEKRDLVGAFALLQVSLVKITTCSRFLTMGTSIPDINALQYKPVGIE